MTGADGRPDRLAEIAGLAAAIADRILEQHAAGTSIPPKHFDMLVGAARMLQDNGVPWPPSVEQVLMEVARRTYQVDAPPEGVETGKGGDNVVGAADALLKRVKRPDGAGD